jgi:hypothetical protein
MPRDMLVTDLLETDLQRLQTLQARKQKHRFLFGSHCYGKRIFAVQSKMQRFQPTFRVRPLSFYEIPFH